MQINEQALLNATLGAVVLADQLGYKAPEWARIVSLLALTVSVAYSIASIPVKSPAI